MALFKVILKEGEIDPFIAKTHFPLLDYTIFQTGNVKDFAIKTELIKEVKDITGVQSTFPAFTVDSKNDSE